MVLRVGLWPAQMMHRPGGELNNFLPGGADTSAARVRVLPPVVYNLPFGILRIIRSGAEELR